MYKLVIFDLDGTLVNSLADLGNAVGGMFIPFVRKGFVQAEEKK